MEQVFLEIKNYGHTVQKKKLIAGIVLTGGGSQLKHLKQLVEYITGMDTRIGYPGEHLAGETSANNTSPMYATAVGLLMKALESAPEAMGEEERMEDSETLSLEESSGNTPKTSVNTDRKTIIERFGDRLKEFLDNA